MDLRTYLDSVREQVAHASALADEHTQEVALKLSAALDSALRLSLIQALSDAAAEITADLAPSTVEVRMAGTDPEFVVNHVVPTTEESTDDDTDCRYPAEPETEDEPQARVSLRLPASVKKRIDEVAASEQISTNAWITGALLNHLRRTERQRAGRQRGSGRGGGRRRGDQGGWNGPGWTGDGPGWSGSGQPFSPGPPSFPPQGGGWGKQQRGYRGGM